MAAGDITSALEAARRGEAAALPILVDLVYAELKKMATYQLRRERSGHTLQPTALVNETYIRLLGSSRIVWENRAHFFRAAASAMRHILVDHARAARAQRRGGGEPVAALEEDVALPGIAVDIEEVLAVDAALEKLNQISSRQKTIVEMRFYAGFTEEEIGEMLRLSTRTVKREWAVARAWLHGECADAANRKTEFTA